MTYYTLGMDVATLDRELMLTNLDDTLRVRHPLLSAAERAEILENRREAENDGVLFMRIKKPGMFPRSRM